MRPRPDRDLERRRRDDERLRPLARQRPAPRRARLQQRLARGEVDLVGDVELPVGHHAPFADDERTRRPRDPPPKEPAPPGAATVRLRAAPFAAPDLTGFARTPLCWAAANMDDRLSSDLASLRIDRNERPPSPSSASAVRWLVGVAVVGGAAPRRMARGRSHGRVEALQDRDRRDGDRARLARRRLRCSSRRRDTSFRRSRSTCRRSSSAGSRSRRCTRAAS